MRIFGHNTCRPLAVAAAVTLLVGAAPAALAQPISAAPAAPAAPAVPVAQTANDTSSQPASPVFTSSLTFPRLPSVEVPKGVRDAAGVFGIAVPQRIELDPRVNNAAAKRQATTAPVEVPETAPLEEKVAAKSREQLLAQGHAQDAEAQRIASDWAREAVEGKATFTGDVGRGTTGLTRGTGNIYRLSPTDALERMNYLTKDERVDAVETTQDPNPKRFGVATATSKDGKTIYLVEYFLN